MLKRGSELLYNNLLYIVVQVIKLPDVDYYFVINKNNKDDYFFCTYESGLVTPVMDVDTLLKIISGIKNNFENEKPRTN